MSGVNCVLFPVLYRGCADSLNWPKDLDMTYNGCRHQSYGEWSDTDVMWCFCNRSLCNVNITHIQSSFPDSSSGQVQRGQTIKDQAKESQGIGYWHQIIDGGHPGGRVIIQPAVHGQGHGPHIQGPWQVVDGGVATSGSGYVINGAGHGVVGGGRPPVVDPLIYSVGSGEHGQNIGNDPLSPPIIVHRQPGQVKI